MAITAGSAALASDVALGANMPSGFIGIWTGTIATIPAGWLICDGNSSTPNLLAQFVEGVATAATNPGTTGGAVSKTTTGHKHTTAALGEMGGGASGYDTKTDDIADIRPPYYDVAFIMKS
jgi:uncharacterized membrane protein AbrB (regulator of aidB expression)